MDNAKEIWKLARDVIFVLSGVGLLYLIALGVVDPAIGPALIPVAAGLCGLPAFLRSDERKRKNGD